MENVKALEAAKKRVDILPAVNSNSVFSSTISFEKSPEKVGEQ